jgi:hypothetical protein
MHVYSAHTRHNEVTCALYATNVYATVCEPLPCENSEYHFNQRRPPLMKNGYVTH